MIKNLKIKLTSIALSCATLANMSSCGIEKGKVKIETEKQTVSFEKPTVEKEETKQTTTTPIETTKPIITETTTETTIETTTQTTTYVQNLESSKETYTTIEPIETKNVKIYEKNDTEQTLEIPVEQTTTTVETTVENELEINEKTYIRYMNVQDACAFFNRYNITTLTQEIEKSFHPGLNQEERLRYDTLFEKTGNKYKECLNLYETGQIDEFNNTIEELMTSKEYMCLDDVMQIYAFAINGYEGKRIIQNPNNYIIEKDAIVIDGIRINNVLPQHGYTDYTNPFTMLNYYYENSLGNCDEDTMELMNLYTVKVFLPYIIRDTRIGENYKKGEMYTYTNMGLEKVLNDSKRIINEEYDVASWDYNTELHTYTVTNSEGYTTICDVNSDLFKRLENCDKIDDFNTASKLITFIGKDEEILKNTFTSVYQKDENQYIK